MTICTSLEKPWVYWPGLLFQFLNSGHLIFPPFAFLLRIASDIVSSSLLSYEIQNCFSTYVKSVTGILMWTILSFYIAFHNIDIFTPWILKIHNHKRYFYLLVPSVFSMQHSVIFLLRFISRIFMFWYCCDWVLIFPNFSPSSLLYYRKGTHLE